MANAILNGFGQDIVLVMSTAVRLVANIIGTLSDGSSPFAKVYDIGVDFATVFIEFFIERLAQETALMVNVIDMIFKPMGGFGDAVIAVVGVVCSIIRVFLKETHDFLNVIAQGLTGGAVSVPNWGGFNCPANSSNTGNNYQDNDDPEDINVDTPADPDVPPPPFRRRLGNASAADGASQAARALRKFDWSGQTVCAMRGQAFDPARDELDAQMVWCISNRVKMLAIAHYVPGAPPTLLDDWTQPLSFGVRAGHAWLQFLRGKERTALGMWVHSMMPGMPARLRNVTGAILGALDRGHQQRARERAFEQPAGGAALPKLTLAGLVENMPRLPPPLHQPAPRVGAALRSDRGDAVAAADACATQYCLQCPIVESWIDVTKQTAELTYAFYSQIYPDIKQEFVDHFYQHNATARRQRARAKQASDGITYARSYKPSEAHRIDAFFDAWYQAFRHGDWDTIGAAFRGAFIGSANESVPLFGHSLLYCAEELAKPCDLDSLFAVDDSHRPEMWHALVATGIMIVAWYLFNALGFFPLPVVWAFISGAFVFLALAYNYVPRCLPELPVTLVHDIKRFVYAGQGLPSCFCPWAQVLATQPCPAAPCSPFDKSVAYRDCPSRDGDLGVLWPLLFLLRWQARALFELLVPKLPFSSAQVDDWLRQARARAPPPPVEVACFWAETPDLLLLAASAGFIGSALFIVVQQVVVALLGIFNALVFFYRSWTQSLQAEASAMQAAQQQQRDAKKTQ